MYSDKIVVTVKNYRKARGLEDSQAGDFSLGAFLLGLPDAKGTGKYRPGFFNLKSFSRGQLHAHSAGWSRR